MTDLFEQQLAERLHAHPLPEEQPDLGARSVRRAQAIRRRRLASLVLAIVVLLITPAGIYSWFRASGTEAPLVGRPTPPPTADVPRLVILDPEGLPAGAAPSLGVVRGRSVQLADGQVVELPADQIGSVSQYRSEVVWVAGSGGDLQLSAPSMELPLPMVGQLSVPSAEPGPAGSVMVRTADGPVLLTTDRTLVRPTEAQLRTEQMVAGARALWVDHNQRVVQVDMSDLQAESFKITNHPMWRKVLFADPRADLVTVESVNVASPCHAVVRGSTADVVWSTCDWSLLAFSPDARFVVGQNKQSGSLDIIDLLSGRAVLAIDLAYPPFAAAGPPGPDQLVFDEEGRLNLVAPRISDGALVGVICPVSGKCWRSTEPTTGDLRFVLPNRG
jgi:hypothetical protein